MSPEAWLQALQQGAPEARRRALAKAITLLESSKAEHREPADALLAAVQPLSGAAFRLGLSGVPGVGKSTFIEALGLFLIERGHRVAVLAVDPSSSVSGGSILGDKTRMERLSVSPQAFIRPSPARGNLGGVAEATREAMLVCEVGGYDVVLVETVGVGQSESAVANMTDMFVLLQLPNAGDDLQAIKRGVMELADMIVVNKADLDPDAATRAQATLTSSVRLLGLGHADDAGPMPEVLQLSALHGQGLEDFWVAVARYRDHQQGEHIKRKRRHQALAWMWDRVDAGLRRAFHAHPEVRRELATIETQVAQGLVPASTAARRLLAAQTEKR
ncbi:MAG: methylmalonyl Co-A mutase-associated GTPase MeaB [Proteobacteria bacterium]|nr:methylmalonyl Co-A mutase-associated GTPase MeaB [Pseudomonadota bacterium]MDA0869821.1 methylmalonyl Co-A mutase-associated GTPase MeaB [Pseudomonadota bacterium]MDA1328852.1 methylmalonyl Co-A mutase-associated GTPase MeaB [Pseudomonadota bacterium]